MRHTGNKSVPVSESEALNFLMARGVDIALARQLALDMQLWMPLSEQSSPTGTAGWPVSRGRGGNRGASVGDSGRGGTGRNGVSISEMSWMETKRVSVWERLSGDDKSGVSTRLKSKCGRNDVPGHDLSGVCSCGSVGNGASGVSAHGESCGESTCDSPSVSISCAGSCNCDRSRVSEWEASIAALLSPSDSLPTSLISGTKSKLSSVPSTKYPYHSLPTSLISGTKSKVCPSPPTKYLEQNQNSIPPTKYLEQYQNSVHPYQQSIWNKIKTLSIPTNKVSGTKSKLCPSPPTKHLEQNQNSVYPHQQSIWNNIKTLSIPTNKVSGTKSKLCRSVHPHQQSTDTTLQLAQHFTHILKILPGHKYWKITYLLSTFTNMSLGV